MTILSVLDLVPVREDGSVAEALADATRLAQAAEAYGYHRFWVAEHHAMDGIAGGATSVVLSHIGNATSRIRIGSGGIMLPNHTPFQIAEQFGTLDALFPGRIDLGLGRAPGAGPELQRALRKNLHQAAEMFPQDVLELRALITGDVELPIHATPGRGAEIEFWMLGSSLFGASLAAQLGMPYAFAAHFAPDHLDVHRDLASYEAAKAHLFTLGASGTIVANADDPVVMRNVPDGAATVTFGTGGDWHLDGDELVGLGYALSVQAPIGDSPGSSFECVDSDGDGSRELITISYQFSGDVLTWERGRADGEELATPEGTATTGDEIRSTQNATCGDQTLFEIAQ